MIHLTVNHTFLGGKNPRTEVEELSGYKGSDYSISDRSDKEYLLGDKGSLTGTFVEDSTIDLVYDSQLVEFFVNHTNVTDDTTLGVDRYEKYVGEKEVVKARVFDGFEPKQQTKTVTVTKGMGDVVFPYEKISEEVVPVDSLFFVRRSIGTTPNTPDVRVPILISPANATDKGVTFTIVDSTPGREFSVTKDGTVRGLTQDGDFVKVQVKHSKQSELSDECEVHCQDKDYPIRDFDFQPASPLLAGEYHKMLFSYVPSNTTDRDFSFKSDKDGTDVKILQGMYAVKHDVAEEVTLTITSKQNNELVKEFKLNFVEEE